MFDITSLRGITLFIILLVAILSGWYWLHPESLMAISKAIQDMDSTGLPIIIGLVLVIAFIL